MKRTLLHPNTFHKKLIMGLNKVLQFLVPKDSKFFPLFIGVAENLVEGCKTFKTLVTHDDAEKRTEIIGQIKDIEHKGDGFTHDIFRELNSTFITPFDRQDIQEMACSIDNVLDYIDGTCQRILLYKPKRLPKELDKSADILIECSELILFAVQELKKHKNYEKIKEACIRINTLENIADDAYHVGLSDLFENEKDPIELIKMKEILQAIEKAIDCAEDVSDVLKTIILKQS